MTLRGGTQDGDLHRIAMMIALPQSGGNTANDALQCIKYKKRRTP